VALKEVKAVGSGSESEGKRVEVETLISRIDRRGYEVGRTWKPLHRSSEEGLQLCDRIQESWRIVLDLSRTGCYKSFPLNCFHSCFPTFTDYDIACRSKLIRNVYCKRATQTHLHPSTR